MYASHSYTNCLSLLSFYTHIICTDIPGLCKAAGQHAIYRLTHYKKIWFSKCIYHFQYLALSQIQRLACSERACLRETQNDDEGKGTCLSSAKLSGWLKVADASFGAAEVQYEFDMPEAEQREMNLYQTVHRPGAYFFFGSCLNWIYHAGWCCGSEKHRGTIPRFPITFTVITPVWMGAKRVQSLPQFPIT
ncbi:hypothetical protein AVEN_187913-1 [Araneus ventricosus]|uniref:Uncharacterized protein n=1 Tax=Araneus ventricosus TaxID=182803 RepID=A0A4Y2RZE1_ARAVE|nr:hypothetical protein AVEN_187913-1 [Araneus ventricosus]